MYIVQNITCNKGRIEELPDRGLGFDVYCHFSCMLEMKISPTDLRYDGAQITGIVDLPECYNSSNVTDTVTLNIQGT